MTTNISNIEPELSAAGDQFAADLQRVRKIGDVEGAFARLLGHPAVLQLREVAPNLQKDEKRRLKQAFREAISELYNRGAAFS